MSFVDADVIDRVIVEISLLLNQGEEVSDDAVLGNKKLEDILDHHQYPNITERTIGTYLLRNSIC